MKKSKIISFFCTFSLNPSQIKLTPLLEFVLINSFSAPAPSNLGKTAPTRRQIKHIFKGGGADRCFLTPWQHLVYSTAGVETTRRGEKKQKYHKQANQTPTVRFRKHTRRKEGQHSVHRGVYPPCCPLILSFFAHHCTCTAVCLGSASQWLF